MAKLLEFLWARKTTPQVGFWRTNKAADTPVEFVEIQADVNIAANRTYLYSRDTQGANDIIYRWDLPNVDNQTLIYTWNASNEPIILFASNSKIFGIDLMSLQIFVADIDGSNRVNLSEAVDTDGIADDICITDQYLFASTNNATELWRMDRDGTNLTQLLVGYPSGTFAHLGADDSFVYMGSSIETTNTPVRRCDIDGSNLSTLFTVPNDIISLTNDSYDIYVLESTVPGQVRSTPIDGSNLQPFIVLTNATAIKAAVISQEPFAADSILVKVFQKTFAADSLLQKTFAKVFAADSLLMATIQKTFAADSLLQKTFAKPFAADSLLQKTFAKVFAADSLLQKTFAKPFAADTILTGTIQKSFTSDSVLIPKPILSSKIAQADLLYNDQASSGLEM